MVKGFDPRVSWLYLFMGLGSARGGFGLPRDHQVPRDGQCGGHRDLVPHDRRSRHGHVERHGGIR